MVPSAGQVYHVLTPGGVVVVGKRRRGAAVQVYLAFADSVHYLGELVRGQVFEMGLAIISRIHSDDLHRKFLLRTQSFMVQFLNVGFSRAAVETVNAYRLSSISDTIGIYYVQMPGLIRQIY